MKCLLKKHSEFNADFFGGALKFLHCIQYSFVQICPRLANTILKDLLKIFIKNQYNNPLLFSLIN